MCEFVFIAEAGALEIQSLLLCESLRVFGGRYAQAPVVILQPRATRPISPAGRQKFESLGARWVELEVNSPCPEYGTSFKVLALAEYEGRTQSEVLIFMDSDMVVLAEPDLELGDHGFAARPVDVKGMCTAGENDPFDSYWRTLCRICGVDYDRVPMLTSTVDQVTVKASYNGGLLVARPSDGLFARTSDFFLKSVAAKLLPWPDRNSSFSAGHGRVPAEGGRYWGSSQAALSLAATSLDLRIRTLPPTVNFPLHFHDTLCPRIDQGLMSSPSLIHYHAVFREHRQRNPLLTRNLGLDPKSIEWLQSRARSFV